MAFDGFVLPRIAEELQAFVGRAIEGGCRHGPHDLWVPVVGGPRLLLSCRPDAGRLSVCDAEVPAEGTPWCPKRLGGALLAGVRQGYRDRVLVFDLDRSDQAGEQAHSTILLELTGRNANVVLVDRETGLIVDALRKVTPEMSRHRQILPRRAYQPPPRQDRVDPARCDLDGFRDRLASSLGRTVLDALVGTLPLAGAAVARYVAHQAAVCPDVSPGDLGEDETRRLLEASASLYALDLSGSPPYLLLDETGRPSDFSVVPPVWLPPEQVVRCARTLDAADQYFRGRVEEVQVADIRGQLAKTIEQALVAGRRKTENLRQDLERAQCAELYRISGEVLTASLPKVRRGLSSIELDNFYDPGGAKITIALDPKRSPADNAQRYFSRYRKAKEGKERIVRQLETAQRSVVRASAYEAQLADSHTLQALQKLQEALQREGILPPTRRRPSGAPRGKEGGRSPRRYVTSGGWTVLVGRTDAQNDILTHRIAGRSDLWFHAHGCAGSHVVLRREDRRGEPGRRDIEEAAGLAAFWSKARGSGTVAVSYTQAKYVSKPKGAKPGMAAYRFEKTLFVAPGLIQEARAAGSEQPEGLGAGPKRT